MTWYFCGIFRDRSTDRCGDPASGDPSGVWNGPFQGRELCTAVL